MLLLFVPLVLYLFSHTPMPQQASKEVVLASKKMSLEKRYPNYFVNEVFKENILLNLAYMRGIVRDKNGIDWVKVTEPFTYTMVLKPGDVFAFHDTVPTRFQTGEVKTTNAHFNAQEGFKSDGYLVGDGVCHLASLMYWAAQDAKLMSEAPTRHDFANIPEVPKEYGVSIYNMPGNKAGNERQNLYIKNDKKKPIAFVFSYENDQLKIDVKEVL